MAGSTSAMTEFGGIYAELRDQGISHKDAWEQAGVKSGVIGLFDAASFNSAGNAMNQIAKNLSKGSAKGAIKETAKETGKQAGFGAAGEALRAFLWLIIIFSSASLTMTLVYWR
jgi:hypothetical protein